MKEHVTNKGGMFDIHCGWMISIPNYLHFEDTRMIMETSIFELYAKHSRIYHFYV